MVLKLKLLIEYILFFPFFITFTCNVGGKVAADLDYAYEVCRFYRSDSRWKMFMNLIIHLPEWRQLYMLRIGFVGYVLKILYGKNLLLFINCSDIEGGIFIQHGYATHINANSIGSRTQIWQNVTIGVKQSGGERPCIGRNVKIYTGARVLGGIKVGDNSIVGANAVVLTDVPDNYMAVGVPARLIPIKKN